MGWCLHGEKTAVLQQFFTVLACDHSNDDEVMLNVLGCQLTY